MMREPYPPLSRAVTRQFLARFTDGSSRVHRRLRPAPQAPFQWAFEKRKGLAKGERGFRKGGRALYHRNKQKFVFFMKSTFSCHFSVVMLMKILLASRLIGSIPYLMRSWIFWNHTFELLEVVNFVQNRLFWGVYMMETPQKCDYVRVIAISRKSHFWKRSNCWWNGLRSVQIGWESLKILLLINWFGFWWS